MMKKVFGALLIMLAFLVVPVMSVLAAPETTGQEGMAYREYPISATIMLEGSGEAQYAQTLTLKPGEYFRVELFAAGATGFQWICTPEKPELAKIVYQNTAPVDAYKNMCGGKTKTVYIFRVNAGVNDQETLQFSLQRSWEKEIKPLQTLELTVNVGQ